MKKYNEGSASDKIIALVLVAALVLSFGVTALALGADDEPLDIIDIEEPYAEEQLVEEPSVEDQPAEKQAAEEQPAEDLIEVEFIEDPSAEAPVVDGTEVEDELIEVEAVEKLSDETSEIEEGQEYLYGPINDSIIAAAAQEIATLSEEQKNQIIDTWEQNCLVYNSPEEMLSVYYMEGMSEQAAFVLILANIDAHVAYINHYFPGEDRTYLDKYNDAYAVICESLNEMGINLADVTERNVLIENISEAYAAMRWAEENEEAGTGERSMFNVANTYWDEQAGIDVRAFLTLCEEIVG